MQIYYDIRDVRLPGPTFLTIGNFDGIHLGHQILFRRLREEADRSATAENSPRTALLTFDPHPLEVLRPDKPLQLLTTPTERIELLEQYGIDVAIVQSFTLDFAQLEPAAFMKLLKKHLGLAGLVVGPDFALGRNRSGDLDTLRALGNDLDYAVTVLEPIDLQGKEVRSDYIRQLLRRGNVAAAAPLLGRYYFLSGTVEEGDKRGRQLGTPTANLHILPNRLLPADGVYATRTWLGKRKAGRAFHSVTNVGLRPTVDGTQRRVETHLFNFPSPGQSGDLYGRTLTVEFVERLRGEQKFDGVDELVAQIRRDIDTARRILATADQGRNAALEL